MQEQEYDRRAAIVRDLVKNRRHEEALRCVEELVADSPVELRNRDALRLRAYVHQSAKRYECAFQDLDEAITHCPSSPGNYDARMMLNLKLGRYEAVEADSTRLLEIERARQSIAFVNAALISRGLARAYMGRRNEALADLSQVSDDGPFWLGQRLWTKEELIAFAEGKT